MILFLLNSLSSRTDFAISLQLSLPTLADGAISPQLSLASWTDGAISPQLSAHPDSLWLGGEGGVSQVAPG